jgi:hypothetical protein
VAEKKNVRSFPAYRQSLSLLGKVTCAIRTDQLSILRNKSLVSPGDRTFYCSICLQMSVVVDCRSSSRYHTQDQPLATHTATPNALVSSIAARIRQIRHLSLMVQSNHQIMPIALMITRCLSLHTQYCLGCEVLAESPRRRLITVKTRCSGYCGVLPCNQRAALGFASAVWRGMAVQCMIALETKIYIRSRYGRNYFYIRLNTCTSESESSIDTFLPRELLQTLVPSRPVPDGCRGGGRSTVFPSSSMEYSVR